MLCAPPVLPLVKTAPLKSTFDLKRKEKKNPGLCYTYMHENCSIVHLSVLLEFFGSCILCGVM